MVKQGNLLNKTLVIGIILLFIGISAYPTVSNSIRDNTGISLITIKAVGEMEFNDWYVSNVGFTFTNESSDIAEIKYNINGGIWQTYTEPFNISDDGKNIRLDWYAVDSEDNQSDVDGPFLFNIDQTPPSMFMYYEVIDDNHWWQGSDILVTVNTTDAMSGMDYVEFYLNDELQKIVTGLGPNYEWQFKYYNVLNIWVSAKAFDKAGNFDYLVIDEYEIENMPRNVPQLHSSNIGKESSTNGFLDDGLSSEIGEREYDRIIEKTLSDDLSNEVFNPAYVIVVFNREMGENGWIVSNVSIPIYFESDRINEVYYQIDEEGWLLYSEPLVISEDGEHCFSWYVVDSEGFTSNPDSISFKIDRTPPEINLRRDRLSIFKFKTTANVYDETSNINRVRFYKSDSGYTDYDFPYEWIWNGYFFEWVEVKVYDNAGNCNSTSMIMGHSHSYNPRSLNPLILRFFERFPLLEVFLRAMNLLR